MRMFFIFAVCCGALLFVAPSAPAQVESSTTAKQKPIPPCSPRSVNWARTSMTWPRQTDWTQAAEKLAALKDEVKRLGSELPAAGTDEDHSEEKVIAIDKAVTAKDRQATMRAANQVTLLVANLTEPFGPTVPADVTRSTTMGASWSSGLPPRTSTS